MLGLGLSLQKGVSAFNAGRALVSSYIRRVTDAGGVLQNTACDAAAINELNQDRLLEPASWVLVPDGIEEDIVFAQKPISGLGDLQFTRASDATYTDSTGVVRRSPYNLLQQSEMFSNAVWTKSNSTISIDATVAPNGTLTADLFTPANATSGRIDQVTGLIVQNNNSYTGSFYFKNPTLAISNITFYASDGNSAVGTNRIGVTIDLATFAATAYNFGNGVTTTVNVTAFGNNWYRASFTGSVSSGATGNWAFVARVLTVDGTINGTNGLFLWGAQLVEGTSALDYFPTTNRQDVPRIDFRNADGTLSSCGRFLLEPQRTNEIRNSSMVGAVAGTTGTLPTNWEIVSSVGLTRTIIGTGTENGLPYIDMRFAGTSTGTLLAVWYEAATQISASTAQTWTNSFYIKSISGAPAAYAITIRELDAAGTTLRTASSTIVPTSTLQRFSYTRTNDGVGTAFVRPSIYLTLVNGTAYDFTIRIAAPQMELGGYATTWVPTTTAAVTRLADFPINSSISSLIGGTSGTWYIQLDTRSTSSSGTNAVIGVAGVGKNVGIANSGNNSAFRLNVNGLTDAITQNITNTFKMAISFDATGVVCFVDGQQKTLTNTSTQILSGLTSVSFATGTRFEYINLHQSAFFPTRLTNDQLEVLTSEGYGTYALLAQSLNCVLQ